MVFAVEAGPASSIRGTTFFDAMIDAFGEDAKAIRGFWVKGPHGGPSINIDKVNELTALGMDLAEAVEHCWTVTRARKKGFGRVTILAAEPPNGAGNYRKVEVLIERLDP